MNDNNKLWEVRRNAFLSLLSYVYDQGFEDGLKYPNEGYGHPDWFMSCADEALRIHKGETRKAIDKEQNYINRWKIVK